MTLTDIDPIYFAPVLVLGITIIICSVTTCVCIVHKTIKYDFETEYYCSDNTQDDVFEGLIDDLVYDSDSDNEFRSYYYP